MFSKMIMTLSLLAAFTLLAPAQATADEVGPKQAVEITVNQVIDVLKNREDQSTLSETDRENIRAAVEQYFDFEEMGKRALAAPWKELTDAQREEFVGLFRDLLELTYGNRLAGFHGQKVAFGEEFIKGRIAVVDSEVIDGEVHTPIRYKLVHKDAGWRVYEIKVEGVSMISTFRTDFTSTYDKEGADGFLASLRERVAGMRNQDKG